MKKMLPASLVLAAMCYCTVSQAQTSPQDQAQPPQIQAQPQAQPQAQSQVQVPLTPTAENSLLDEHFSQCINNKDCSTQVRMQIIQEENDAMNTAFQKIHQVCADANFNNCLDKEKDDVQAWYSAQDNMRAMMGSMGEQDMNAKEPAAGEPSSMVYCKKTFWQKIWPFGKNADIDANCSQ